MLPSLHSVERTLLLLKGQAVEVLEALAQLLLSFRRQLAKLGIVLKGRFLLIERHALVATQPIASMMLVSRWRLLRSIALRWPGLGLLVGMTVLRRWLSLGARHFPPQRQAGDYDRDTFKPHRLSLLAPRFRSPAYKLFLA
jgi:hypothetical protein